MSSKRMLLIAGPVVLIVAVVVLVVVGVLYGGVKQPSEKVTVSEVGCTVADQKDFTNATINTVDNSGYITTVKPMAQRIMKQAGYAKNPNCAYIVFMYDMAFGNISQAKSLVSQVSNELDYDDNYMGNQALYTQMQSQLTSVTDATQGQ